MANRRMFSKKITDTDFFLDMPLSTQALYFHLNMHADDDGFVDNSKKIMRMIGAADDDMKILLTKQFILPFDNGVVVIKDWRIHNYIAKDRHTPTMYKNELKQLATDDNGSYTERIQNVDESSPQVRLGKDRLGKDSKEGTLSDKSDVLWIGVIYYLNEKTGHHYRNTPANKRLILARMHEGFTADDCKKVIDNKVADWANDPKMSQYLRPATLFNASKFEGYLNETQHEEVKGYGGLDF